MFASFWCHAEFVCADISFRQQQYLLKAKNKENEIIWNKWKMKFGS